MMVMTLTAGKFEIIGSMTTGIILIAHFIVWPIVPAFTPSAPIWNDERNVH